ncbi:biotin operon repressor/biotin--[acetyl-CoA-carboxylase] ligase family protein [Streptococcus oralis SK255]|uniref:Biotin operon repressor/biotin--[acetyl-CoA-carboxylase] ligase family protein n=1 Tax=Streptococcus oralis SK255 TaxID=1005704 RepID=F5VS15_STROR|nr:biotin operon repressor/biotin--[acetyl-CoA-carboxylase] ligase family protein [Streptococcus oralis SK255]
MTSVETGLVTDVIIGLGINFAIEDFPEDLKEKAGSLFMPPAPITRNELISEIWRCFYQTAPEELLYLYKEHSLVLGREVSFIQDQTKKKESPRTSPTKDNSLFSLMTRQKSGSIVVKSHSLAGLNKQHYMMSRISSSKHIVLFECRK